ncbi:hypothetical protein CW304_30605 [Bacillus sp. UFRGS-B20]|nr:hypothetical protein CW304_30605 [Bacillus sp. UFRGS-B20]
MCYPRSPSEELYCRRFWSQVLGTEKSLALPDSFPLNVVGNSLLATQIVSRLQPKMFQGLKFH